MATATWSSPWGNKPGAWALDSEEHEAGLKRQESQQKPPQNDVAGATEFPSLAAAVKQPKKKKAQPLSLAEFSGYRSDKPKSSLSHEDLFELPTGPRQRSADELDRTRLGGGFKSYGLSNRNGDDSRWGSGNNNNSNNNSRGFRETEPSRADEIDDWSKTKKSTVAINSSGNGFERREKSSLFESHSKADELDNWVSSKPAERRRFDGGFEKRGSFDSLSRERQGLNGVSGVDTSNWGRKKEESDGTVTTRPRLVLQPRTLPLSEGNGTLTKPKGASPFGDARPREEVLAEKGKDWKEIDEKLESLKVNNGKKDGGKGEGGDSGSFGSRISRVERSWKKADDAADLNSRPQSAGKTANGHNAENGHDTESGSTEGN